MPLSKRNLTRATALALAVLLPASACYRTVPLADGPEPGMRVVAVLTSEGSVRLAEHIGSDIVRVEGEAAALQPEEVSLLMVRTWDRGGREYPWSREPITLPRQYVSSLQQRELDRPRSWALAGAITAVALVLGRTFVKGVLDAGNNGDNGDVPGQ
jgi:hypothetical protein